MDRSAHPKSRAPPSAMLCSCGRGKRPSDEISLYSYTPSRGFIFPPADPTGSLAGVPALPPPRHASSPKQAAKDLKEEREVLLADEEYPEQPSALNGSANMGFDSGIESGTLTTFDSLDKTMTLSQDDATKVIPDSGPVLEYMERPSRRRGSQQPDKQSRVYQAYKGQLKLAVYVNHGLLTVHLQEGKAFQSKYLKECCSYAKVSLVPDSLRRTKCRTDVIKNSNSPSFDEKFSFELLEEDVQKRLLISIWNRVPSKQHSELLGCMSFGVQRIVDKKAVVKGWYFLLTEHVGKRKHLHVQDNWRPLLSIPDAVESECMLHMHASSNDVTSDYSGSMCGELCNIRLKRDSVEESFGMALTAGSPAQIFTIEPGSPSDIGGLLIGHRILRINGQDVSRATSDTVARIIRYCAEELCLEVHKCHSDTCLFVDADADDAASTCSALSPWKRSLGTPQLSPAKSTSWAQHASAVLSEQDYSKDATLS